MQFLTGLFTNAPSFAKTHLGPNSVFVDLGSGVGNCVVQAALAYVSRVSFLSSKPHFQLQPPSCRD